MEQQFQYYAFISYKREDEKWAKWLQDRLRWYKLPSKLCRQITRLPKKVWPVFRDNTDLDSGRLEENIRHELERSHYLIVICSPEAARSPWVGKEVKYFATLHGADKIIPFVVSGIPYSNDIETECIHEQIKAISQEELLAINVREEGIGSFAMKKKRAFIRVVARLLDIKFNTLWQPYERILRIRKWSTGIGVVLFLFVLFILWDYYRTKNEYFADYVDRWGIPEGVIELSAEQVKKRSTHYRFEYTHRSILGKGKGTLKRVVFANSAGFPIEHNFSEYVDRSSIQQIESRKDRRGQSVIEIEYQNSKQKPLIVAYIAGDSLQYVDLKSLDKGMGIGLTSSFTSITSNAFESMFSNSKSEIRRYRLIRDRQGFIIRKLFKKYNGNDDIAACDAKGIYGFDYLLDSIGRPRLVRFIGFEGFNFPNNMGIASKKYNYDEYGNISVIAYLDPAGNPVLNEQRWATYTRKCDENGNIVKGVYLGIDQKICPLSNGGGIIGKEYDEHGNSITESIFDKDGQLAWGREGVARCVAKYNKQGRIIETANYGTDGNLCFNKKGYARLLSTYDDCGNVIEMAYYGVDGAPCFNKKGYAKWIGRYDKYGNMIESAYFDTDGEPVRDKEGVMKVEAVYNNKGYISSISYVDAGGNLVPNKIGIAQVTITYDNNNNLYDNGLAFLILACFHELEHRLQNEHPEKLRLQQDFAQEIYSIERFIILFRNYAPELMEIDYKKFHDNFLLEIDADTKGVNNAIAFSRGTGISSINFKYYELFSQYNNFRIQNYDTLIIINQFLKIANKYKSKAINGNYLPGKILNYFDENGNLKNIDDLMEIQNSSIIQYIVSSPEFLKSINQSELTKEQCEFISNCINDVLNEHYFKKAFTEQNKEQMDSIILELRNYTQISSTNSKTSDSMSNENYYMYLQSKLGSLQAIQFEERKIK